MNSARSHPTRRQFAQVLAGLGIGSATFQRALAAQAAKTTQVTPEMVQQAEWIAGLELKEEDRKALAGALNRSLHDFAELRSVKLTNDVPLALSFQPAPWLPPTAEPAAAVSSV